MILASAYYFFFGVGGLGAGAQDLVQKHNLGTLVFAVLALLFPLVLFNSWGIAGRVPGPFRTRIAKRRNDFRSASTSGTSSRDGGA
jgi:hypothetical protein